MHTVPAVPAFIGPEGLPALICPEGLLGLVGAHGVTVAFEFEGVHALLALASLEGLLVLPACGSDCVGVGVGLGAVGVVCVVGRVVFEWQVVPDVAADPAAPAPSPSAAARSPSPAEDVERVCAYLTFTEASLNWATSVSCFMMTSLFSSPYGASRCMARSTNEASWLLASSLSSGRNSKSLTSNG